MSGCVTHLPFDLLYKQKGSIFRNKMSSSAEVLHNIIILINGVMQCLIQRRTPHITYLVVDHCTASHAPVSTFYRMRETHRKGAPLQLKLICGGRKTASVPSVARLNAGIITLIPSRKLDHGCNVYNQRWHRYTRKQGGAGSMLLWMTLTSIKNQPCSTSTRGRTHKLQLHQHLSIYPQTRQETSDLTAHSKALETIFSAYEGPIMGSFRRFFRG